MSMLLLRLALSVVFAALAQKGSSTSGHTHFHNSCRPVFTSRRLNQVFDLCFEAYLNWSIEPMTVLHLMNELSHTYMAGSIWSSFHFIRPTAAWSCSPTFNLTVMVQRVWLCNASNTGYHKAWTVQYLYRCRLS